MPTRNQFLPYFQRMLIVLRRAIAHLLAKRPVSDTIRIQASALQLGDLYSRGEIDFEGLVDRLSALADGDQGMEKDLLEGILKELEREGLDDEAKAVRERLTGAAPSDDLSRRPPPE